jgi:hypothetical protein
MTDKSRDEGLKTSFYIQRQFQWRLRSSEEVFSRKIKKLISSFLKKNIIKKGEIYHHENVEINSSCTAMVVGHIV